ncbi:MAG: MBL fold metallo-hydrolase, partial [Ilumatobacter sp.]|nr:MBL fold metallo-hydrolase [Ilumatobacter sp.]
MADTDHTAPKPASTFTRERNSAAVIDFDDGVDFAAAAHGLIAQHPTGRIEKNGWPVWDTANHDFLRTDDAAPNTVHPGLWRQGKLNAIHGLFQV